MPEEVAAVRRDFAAGLPERVTALAAALAELRQGYVRTAAESLYLRAHALKGTAASFGADEIVPPAAALADAGRRWIKAGTVVPGEALAAARDLDRLAEAVEQFRARTGDPAP